MSISKKDIHALRKQTDALKDKIINIAIESGRF